MIGDSTMRQMFQSLACILGDHIQSGFLTVGTPPAFSCRLIYHGPYKHLSEKLSSLKLMKQCLRCSCPGKSAFEQTCWQQRQALDGTPMKGKFSVYACCMDTC